MSRLPSRLPRSHLAEDGLPSFVIGAGGQLRDVVGRRIGFEAADLAEIIDGVRGIGRAAADAQKKDPPAVPRTSSSRATMRSIAADIQPRQDLPCFFDVVGCE